MRAVLEDLSAVNAVGRVVLPRRAASPPRVRVATTTYKQSQADDATTNSGPVRVLCGVVASLHRHRLRHAPSRLERMTKPRLPTYKKNGPLAQLDTPPRRREIVTR